MSKPATAPTRKLKPIDARIAIRRWLAQHGPWHSELPANVDQKALDAELHRLCKVGVLDVFGWEVAGLRYELPPLPVGKMVSRRVYKPGSGWASYVDGWST
jgi:hypothetical protein